MLKLPQNYAVVSSAAKPSMTFARQYFSLAILETDIELDLQKPQPSKIMDIATKIEHYLTTTADAYDSIPEQKSIMILTVMELWMSLDKVTIRLFPLLADYSIGFQTMILDVLHLSRLQHMMRAQKIREYLQQRHSDGLSRTVFDDPKQGCFAERYYNESADASRLIELH